MGTEEYSVQSSPKLSSFLYVFFRESNRGGGRVKGKELLSACENCIRIDINKYSTSHLCQTHCLSHPLVKLSVPRVFQRVNLSLCLSFSILRDELESGRTKGKGLLRKSCDHKKYEKYCILL